MREKKQIKMSMTRMYKQLQHRVKEIVSDEINSKTRINERQKETRRKAELRALV